MTPNLPSASECVAFESLAQRVLDRELRADALDTAHAAGCTECRRLAASAVALLAGLDRLPRVEVARSDRIAVAVLGDYRARRRRTWATRAVGFALAASVLVGVAVLGPWSRVTKEPEVVRRPEPVPAPAPERVADRVADAGSALASITKKATDQTLTPTLSLFPPPERVALPDSELASTVDPAAESLASIQQGAKAGIEPMTTGARRAVNLFLRDTGIAPKPKS